MRTSARASVRLHPRQLVDARFQHREPLLRRLQRVVRVRGVGVGICRDG